MGMGMGCQILKRVSMEQPLKMLAPLSMASLPIPWKGKDGKVSNMGL